MAKNVQMARKNSPHIIGNYWPNPSSLLPTFLYLIITLIVY